MRRCADKRILKYTVVEVVCDGCKKSVATDERERGPQDWYSFSSYHSEWENSESYDANDVCSLACYFLTLVDRFDYWTNLGGGPMPTLTIDGKQGPILEDLYKIAQVYLKGEK